MTDRKPFVHELKAHDFFMEAPHDTMSGGPRMGHSPFPWHPMDNFPRDGSAVDVLLEDGRLCVVCWRGDAIVGDGYPGGAYQWRRRS